MKVKCKKCGNIFDSKFCPNCGEPFTNAEPVLEDSTNPQTSASNDSISHAIADSKKTDSRAPSVASKVIRWIIAVLLLLLVIVGIASAAGASVLWFIGCVIVVPLLDRPFEKLKDKTNIYIPGWLRILLAIMLLICGFIVMPGSSNVTVLNQTADTADGSMDAQATDNTKTYDTEIDNRKTDADDTDTEDPKITSKGYMYEDSLGDSIYYVEVTNNSNNVYEIDGNATAKDSAGNNIGAANLLIDVLGPGETSIGSFYFDSVSDIASVDYSLSTRSSYYSPVISDLEVQKTVNDENVVVSVTNKGTKAAEFVEAHALFFDANNNVVYHNSTYVIDGDDELKPGSTISGQLDCYKPFDHVEVYFTGRR